MHDQITVEGYNGLYFDTDMTGLGCEWGASITLCCRMEGSRSVMMMTMVKILNIVEICQIYLG